MDKEIYVTPRQYSILRIVLEKGSVILGEIASLLSVRQEDLMRDLSELELKQLIAIRRSKIKYYAPSSFGLMYLENGFPEEKMYSVLGQCVNRSIDEFAKCIGEYAGLPFEEIQVGLQYLVREKCIEIKEGIVVHGYPDSCSKVLKTTSVLREKLDKLHKGIEIDETILNILKRRKLVELREKTIITLEATNTLRELWNKRLVRERELITVIKPAYSMEIDKYLIKEFDLSIEPPTPPLAKKHPFMQFIDELREILINMGFEEVKGPQVEAELWNFDVLYQAQDHPAREIHDTFFVKSDYRANIQGELLARVRKIHEEGWRYKWSPERATRLVLRSQTTAVSARAIYERGPGEYRIFTIDRNFRPENLDAKHSMEFYQLDGVIVGKEVNFKHLLYFFKELAAALGIREVWFKPGYFPFTEPSVEGYVKHPKLGWIEVFPGGMFRPEVMKILGAEGYNAAAWGIGVDRLAMIVLGLDDIRLLFTQDLDVLENIKYSGLEYFIKKHSGREVKVVKAPL